VAAAAQADALEAEVAEAAMVRPYSWVGTVLKVAAAAQADALEAEVAEEGFSDKCQYPATLGGWYGRMGCSPAEAHNNALADVRETPFVGALLVTAENVTRRHRKCGAAAAAHKGPLPPTVVSAIAPARAYALGDIPLSCQYPATLGGWYERMGSSPA